MTNVDCSQPLDAREASEANTGVRDEVTPPTQSSLPFWACVQVSRDTRN